MSFDPTSSEMQAWLASLQKISDGFFEGMSERRVYTRPCSSKADKRFAISKDAQSVETLLSIVSQELQGSGLDPTSSRFFGYIPGGGLPIAALADFTADLLNRYTGFHATSPAGVEIENAVLEWCREALGLPESSWGVIASGGSTATVVALMAFRKTLMERSSRQVIYCGEHTHHAVSRALDVIGLDMLSVRRIALDGNHRIDVGALVEAVSRDRDAGLDPVLVIGSAGTTETGAVDPMDGLAEVAGRFGMWLHVDAAYGGFFAMLDEMKERFSGFDRADSIVVDPHKSLFFPYGTGIALVRDGENLRRCFAQKEGVLSDVLNPEQRSPADFGIELTRPFRGLAIWMALAHYGPEAFEQALRDKRALAIDMHRALGEDDRLVVGPEPDLSVFYFRAAHGDSLTKELHEKLLDDGRVYLSSAEIDGCYCLRVCVLCFRSDREAAKVCVDEISKGLDSL